MKLLMKLTETFFIRSIPHIDKCVRSTCCKCSVLFMKRNGIHRENCFNLFIFRTMTFEGIFLLLNFGIWIEEFHRDTTWRTSLIDEEMNRSFYLRSNWAHSPVCSGNNECIVFDILDSILDFQSVFDRTFFSNPKSKLYVEQYRPLIIRRPNLKCRPKRIRTASKTIFSSFEWLCLAMNRSQLHWAHENPKV